MLKSYKIYTCTNGALGLHLSRAPWDPYPWVSSIQKDSSSYQAGLRIGDCLLEFNGQDVLGMKISEIAALLKNHWLNESSNHVNVVIWRNKCNNSSSNKNNGNATDVCNKGDDVEGDDDDDDDDEDEENNAHNINQQSLQKFATCLQHIAQLLECPVCLEVIKPPGWQCCNGHVLCNNCRSRSEKCPVCRVPLGPRGRCLLSDKLFTLLADSFPCDGVRSNKNSPKDRRKCSLEFHNQPKMAIVGKHQHQQYSEHEQQQQDKEEQAAKKAKDFILTSLRQRRRRKMSTTKLCSDGNISGMNKQEEEDNSYTSMQKQAIYDGNVVEFIGSNRKSSSADYVKHGDDAIQQKPDGNMEGVVGPTLTTAIQQCHCATCLRPDEIATVNKAATVTQSLNKYMLRIPPSQGQCTTAAAVVNNKEKHQKNYQCPTGKLCCLKNVNVLSYTTNNNFMTATVSPAVATSQQQDRVNSNFYKTLTSEWNVLAHLTEDHQLPVQQYYGVYGQRIQVQNIIHLHSIACLNLRGCENLDTNMEKFFIACIPLDQSNCKVAIFVYHMNTGKCSDINAEVRNFETVIENPVTDIKWFGCTHPLTKPWSHILQKQHFFEHHIIKGRDQQQQQLHSQVTNVSVNDDAMRSVDDSFVFVVKRKLETKTKI